MLGSHVPWTNDVLSNLSFKPAVDYRDWESCHGLKSKPIPTPCQGITLDAALIDEFVVFFGLVYYAVLSMVYVLRARTLTELEWKMGPVFSALLIPFCSLWAINFLIGSDAGRLLAGLPIIVYLGYDLWYRAITRKKPYHHPEHWPIGLKIYLLLLFAGSIGLNWYGYLMSQFYGGVLVVAFFVMMSSFGYYQYEYGKEKKPDESQVKASGQKDMPFPASLRFKVTLPGSRSRRQ